MVSPITVKSEFFRTIGYVPHDGQLRMHSSRARYRLLGCGARWGKTYCAARELMFGLTKPNTRYWNVAPSYDLSFKVFREVLWTFLKVMPKFIVDKSESKQYLRTIIGSELYGKSADNPEALLGESLDGLNFDEPAKCKANIWPEFLFPRLRDRNGWGMFTGTPKGKGWYYRLYLKGKDPNEKNYYSTEGPMWENPLINREQLETEKKDIPERYWRQEVLGEFLDDSGSVFKNIRDHISGTLELPKPNKTYSIGWDPAKHTDWSVLTVLDETGHVCDWERFSQEMDWTLQKRKVIEKSKLYNNATIYADSSGPGDPLMDDLISLGAPVMPIPTAQQKTMLIDSLLLGMDNRQVTYPDLPILINELEIYEHESLPSGRIRYSAPEGFHDDCVISLALAYRGVSTGQSWGVAVKGYE